MRRALERMRNRKAQEEGIGAALQQIFTEDASADAAMMRMLQRLDELDKGNKGRAA